MCQKLLRDTRLYEHLLRCDRDLAREVRERGCPCGGRLDSAKYPRKPQGGPPIPQHLRERDPDHARRLSLCCDDCRKRSTPPSVRFLWRRWFLAATVVLVSALKDGLTSARIARVRELYDVSLRTLERWRAWWLETFVSTDLWQVTRGRFSPPVDERRIPRSLLGRFGRSETKGALVGVLQFLAPLAASERIRRGLIAGPQKVSLDKRGGGS